MPKGFYIWFATYGTYDEPDVPAKLIAGPVSWEKAVEEIKRLGFGYFIKEQI